METLSDHAGRQFERTVQQLRDAETKGAAWQEFAARARQDLAETRRRKGWWRRLLGATSSAEREAVERVRQADQGVAAAGESRQWIDGRARQQAAGVSGEEAFTQGLAAVLDDDWLMLRGYRNRRGETDHVLIGPAGVWAVEVKRRRIRLHVVGEQWWFEKLDAYGNVVGNGWAVDGSGRSWARQVQDVAEDLSAWLTRNGARIPIRTAVIVMHPQAVLGRCEQASVHAVGTRPADLRAAAERLASPVDEQTRAQVAALIRRDHRFHERRRGGRR